MNKEAVFALRFVMKDFAKMRKGIDQINKNLEQMKKTSNNASRGINNVNTAMSKATRSVLKFAAAYFTLSKITSTIFAKSNEAIQLRLIADTAGVAADKIGKLGKALRVYGGDAKAAGSAYSSLTSVIGGATHGMGVSEDIMRVNSMYGIGFNYGNISQDELMTEIARSMYSLRQKGDQWAINQIASAYGLDSSVATFLSKYGTNWKSQADAQKVFMPKESETQQLIKKEDELNRRLEELVFKLEPVLNGLLSAIIQLTDWVYAVWGHKVEAKKTRMEEERNFEKHVDEFAGFQQGKTKKNWFTGEYTTEYDFLPKGTKLERAQHVMDKLRESGWDAKVMTEYLNTGQELAKRYGEDFGYNIGLRPTNNDGFDVIVNVGGVVVQDNTGTLKGKTNALEKGIGSVMENTAGSLARN